MSRFFMLFGDRLLTRLVLIALVASLIVIVDRSMAMACCAMQQAEVEENEATENSETSQEEKPEDASDSSVDDSASDSSADSSKEQAATDGDDENAGDENPQNETEAPTEKKVDFTAIDEQFQDLKKLSKEGEIWFSPKDKAVLIGATICLNRGQLEMFACTPHTKEHESILVINCRAFEAHVGLVAIGAMPGTTVSWDPEYRKATGSEIEVEVHWFDKSGMPQKVRAQQWIQSTRTEKEMEYPWVFAGSAFFENQEDGQKFYLAEGGEFICVSNFTTATLDVPVESGDADEDLLYRAFPDRIPEVGTPVRLVLRLKTEDTAPEKENADKDSPAENNPVKTNSVTENPGEENTEGKKTEKSESAAKDSGEEKSAVESSDDTATDEPSKSDEPGSPATKIEPESETAIE